jgi:hypothetical protein
MQSRIEAVMDGMADAPVAADLRPTKRTINWGRIQKI